jgi:hypothetical protein
MEVFDQKGKVFGWINAIDLFLILVVLATIIGFLWAKTGHTSISKIVKAEGPADVKIAIRGARVEDPKIFEKYKKAFIIIRNQPYQAVEIVSVKAWRRPITFFDQTTKMPIKFPNTDDPLATDIDIVIRDNAQFTGEDIVLGGNKVKAGIPVDLETLEYKFTGSIISIKMAGVVN